MEPISIPPKSSRRWTGPYLGNYYGSLWSTRNIDLDRSEGKIALSRRFERIEDTLSDFTGNNEFIAFVRTDADCTDRYWALAYGGGLSKTDSASPENKTSPADSWDTDALANTPVICRDMTVTGNDTRADCGRNKLFVTTDSGDIAVLNDCGNNVWDSSWWKTTQNQPYLFSATVSRPIEYFPYRKITLVGSGNLLHTISRPADTLNDTVSYARLTLPKNLNIQRILTTSNRAWLLCLHRFGGEGAIVEWDGYSETYNEIHKAYGVSAVSGVNYAGSPIILNSNGIFLENNGQGFQPMVRGGQQVAFPIAEEIGRTFVAGADTSTLHSVSGRGMVVGEDGLIYINAGQPADNVMSSRYSSGIWCLNPRTGRLYNKHSIGRWGDSVDYGQPNINVAGALYWVPNAVSARNLLAGNRVTSSALGGIQTGIWLLEAETSVLLSRGYFITQYISASEVRDAWDSLWVRFQKFKTTGSQIICKARGVRPLLLANRRPLSGTITWTSTTTFTLTLASGDDPLVVGDEVEVLDGVNAGYLAHITVITGAHAAQQTITIDETVTTGSSTSTARFERWKKLGVLSNNTKYEDNVNVGLDSSFIQLKVELRGLASEMEVSDLILNHSVSIHSKK